MASSIFQDDDSEIQLADVTSGEEKKTGGYSPRDSNTSSDSSASDRKQLGPHTIPRNSPCTTCKANTWKQAAAYQIQDRTDEYLRLLEETQKSLSARDNHVIMLQQQLQKMESICKQNLNDSQNLRYKHCVATQELSNLRIICEKYREQIGKILNEKASPICSDCPFLRDEVIKWQTQYKDLLQQVHIVKEKVNETETTITEEKQLTENVNTKMKLDDLKSHYDSVTNDLKQQNEKLELVVKNLQSTLGNKIGTEFYLQNQLDQVNLLNSTSKYCQNICTNLSAKKLDNVKIQNLNNEIEVLSRQNALLIEKNIALENEIQDFENNQEDNISIKNKQYDVEHVPSMRIRDSVIGYLKTKNTDMQHEVEDLQTLLNTSKYDDVPKNDVNAEFPYIMRSREDSRVSFILGPARGDANLKKFLDERIQLSENTAELQNGKKESVAIRNSVIEELQKKVDLMKNDYNDLLEINSAITGDLQNTNNDILEKQKTINKLEDENAALTTQLNDQFEKINDYEKLLKSNSFYSNELKNKEDIINEKSSEIERLKADIKTVRGDLNITNTKNIETLEENIKLKNELQKKSKEFTDTFDKISEENVRCSKELELHSHYPRKLQCIEETLANAVATIETLNFDNEKLKTKLKEMANDMQQYKEEAKFKKLENEKLRKIEDDTKEAISAEKRKLEQSTREYNKQTEENNLKLSKISNEYEEFKNKSNQTEINLIEKNEHLQTNLEQKNIELDKLRNKLQAITATHEKALCCHEGSITEIKNLIKTKEDELVDIVAKLQKGEEDVNKLEEENFKLKQIISENDTMLLKNDKRISGEMKQQNEENLLETDENSKNLKRQDNLYGEVSALKLEMRNLVENFVENMLSPEPDNNKCPESCFKGADSITNNVGQLNNDPSFSKENLLVIDENSKNLERQDNLYGEVSALKLEMRNLVGNIVENMLSPEPDNNKCLESCFKGADSKTNNVGQLNNDPSFSKENLLVVDENSKNLELQESLNKVCGEVSSLKLEMRSLAGDLEEKLLNPKTDNKCPKRCFKNVDSKTNNFGQLNNVPSFSKENLLVTDENTKNLELQGSLNKLYGEVSSLKLEMRSLAGDLEEKLLNPKTDNKCPKRCFNDVDSKTNNFGQHNNDPSFSKEKLLLTDENSKNLELQGPLNKLCGDVSSLKLEMRNFAGNLEEKLLNPKPDNNRCPERCFKGMDNKTNNFKQPNNDPSCSKRETNELLGGPQSQHLQELTIKRQHLLKKVKEIDTKLKASNDSNLLTMRSSSTSNLSRFSCCAALANADEEDLLFQRKFYMDQMKNINGALKFNGTKETVVYNENNVCSASSIAYWKINLEIMRQMAADLNEVKRDLKIRRQFPQNQETSSIFGQIAVLERELKVCNTNVNKSTNTTSGIPIRTTSKGQSTEKQTQPKREFKFNCTCSSIPRSKDYTADQKLINESKQYFRNFSKCCTKGKSKMYVSSYNLFAQTSPFEKENNVSNAIKTVQKKENAGNKKDLDTRQRPSNIQDTPVKIASYPVIITNTMPLNMESPQDKTITTKSIIESDPINKKK